jgi:hypothetical protein
MVVEPPVGPVGRIGVEGDADGEAGTRIPAKKGGLQLFGVFDTRSGTVIGVCRQRKRQEDFICSAGLDRSPAPPKSVTHIHIVCDNLRMHKGMKVRAWNDQHPRFQFHFTPVHCSWMNQIEQWFSILQRKRLCAPNFDNLAELE